MLCDNQGEAMLAAIKVGNKAINVGAHSGSGPTACGRTGQGMSSSMPLALSSRTRQLPYDTSLQPCIGPLEARHQLRACLFLRSSSPATASPYCTAAPATMMSSVRHADARRLQDVG